MHIRYVNLHHVHLRKTHYRRCLLLLIGVWFVGPYLIEHEAQHWVEFVLQLAFFYDPVVAEMGA